MRRKLKPIEVVCFDCGETFTALLSNALRCEKCRKKAKNQAAKKYMMQSRSIRKIPKSMPPRKSIKDILKEMAQYNREHGTCLSYGKYVAMIEKGEY
jgi:tRNA(Ile2) C34 agmatinyltransferase TiaS